MNEAATLSYTMVHAKYCEGKNIHANHPNEGVSVHQCNSKCGPGGLCEQDPANAMCTDGSCTGYLAAYDDADSSALCLPADACKALCTSLTECYGVEVAVDQAAYSRCYLSTYECIGDVLDNDLVADANWNFWYKVRKLDESCPLGYGLRLTYSGEDAQAYESALEGVYDRFESPEDEFVYYKVDGNARVVWHATGCGWAVEELASKRVADGNRYLKDNDCVDDTAAAARALGAAGEDVCGAALWAQSSGYCDHALFAALCPQSCPQAAPTCSGDAHGAAPLLQKMVTGKNGAATCADLKAHCTDSVVASACKSTCAGTATNDAPAPASFVGSFRLSLKAQRDQGRRLGWDCASGNCKQARYYEVFYSFMPELDTVQTCTVCTGAQTPEADGCTSNDASVALADDVELYDVKQLHKELSHQQWTYTCGVSAAYKTHDRSYCPHNNLDVSVAGKYVDATLGDLSAQACSAKCDAKDVPKDGAADPAYCGGMDADFDARTNALCLPRALCEQWCTALDECSSFDMDITRTRCWLNNDYCAPGNNPYDGTISGFGFGAQLKLMNGIYHTSDELEFVYKWTDQDVYGTEEDTACDHTAAPLAPDLALELTQCNNVCGGPKLIAEQVDGLNAGTSASSSRAAALGARAARPVVAIGSRYLATVVEDTVHIGLADIVENEVHFGEPNTLTVGPDKRFIWGNTQIAADASTGSASIAVTLDMATHDDPYFAVLKGSIDELRLTVDFEDPVFIAGMWDLRATAVRGNDMYIVHRDASLDEIVLTKQPLEDGAVAETVSLDARAHFVTTATTTFNYYYFFYGQYNRRLRSADDIQWYYDGTPAPAADAASTPQLNATGHNLTYLKGLNVSNSNASTQVAAVDTSAYLVFAVSSEQGPYLWITQGGLDELAAPLKVGLSACENMDVASVDKEHVLVACAGNSTGGAGVDAVICNVEERSCGVTTGWALHTTGDYPDSVGTGFSVTCPSSRTCLARSRADIFYILTVDLGELEITASVSSLGGISLQANVSKAVEVEAFSGHTVALGPSHVFFTRHAYNGTNDTTYGVLVHELAGTWKERSETDCLAYDAAGGSVDDSVFCGDRASCEAACTALEGGCGFFRMFPDEYKCELYATCTKVDEAQARLMSKTSSNVCQVTVEGAHLDDEIAEACTYNSGTCDLCESDVCHPDGMYKKETGSNSFAKADGSAKIEFGTLPCMGWKLNVNRADPVEVTLTTLHNAPESARVHYFNHHNHDGTDEQPTGATPDCKDVAAADPGSSGNDYHCDDDVWYALCAADCQVKSSQFLSGETHQYHLEGALVDDSKVGVIDTNNADALADYIARMNADAHGNGAHPDAVASAGADYCQDHKVNCELDQVIRSLCPTTCRTRDAFSAKKVKYLPWNAGESDTLFRTYANGSATAFAHDNHPDTPFLVRDLGVPQCPLFGTLGDTSLIAKGKFRATTPKSEMTLKSVCAQEALCPTLTTCVENDFFFDKELTSLRGDLPYASLYASATNGAAAVLSGAMWTDTEGLDFSAASFPYLFPKVLLSTQRAEALIRTSQWEFGKEIFRPVPLHTRLRLRQTGSAHTVTVTLADSADHWSRQQLGRYYAPPAGHDAWRSDVVRIEAFDAAYAKLSTGNAFEFELFVPGVDPALFKVFRFAHGDGTSAAADVTTLGGTVVQTEEGWYSVSVPMSLANADFVATADTDECADAPCALWEDGGLCTNTDGSYTCGCRDGFTAVGGNCRLDSTLEDAYTHPSHEQQFLLYHADDATHGWHVQSVELFDEADHDGHGCMGHSSQMYYNLQVSGKYTDDYSESNIMDMSESEWWSEKLKLSRRDGSGAWVSFNTEASERVACVRVSMSCRQQMPKTFTLHRGTKFRVNASAAYSTNGHGFTLPGTTGWLETVTKNRGEDTFVDLVIPCGIEDSQYFGEIFYEYQFARGTGSPCHCKQLCLDHAFDGDRGAHAGCATWKYYSETEHCYLQRDVFEGTDPMHHHGSTPGLENNRASRRPKCTDGKGCSDGQGWWKRPFASGWHGWVTGAVAPLAQQLILDPAAPVVGEEFSVTLQGAGFPYDEAIKDDLGARQRIKVLPAGDSCVYDTPPDYVEGLDCTNEYACSPRPSAYSRYSATWDKITVTAAKVDAKYQVCWCAGQCWNAANWVRVPGEINVAASAYSWAVHPPLDGPFTRLSTNQLRVSRPAFSSTANRTEWRIKFVKDIFDCEHLADASMCGGAADCGNSTDWDTEGTGPDEALFKPVMTAGLAPKDYHVCFSENEGATWTAIPSADSRFLTVSGLESDASHPRGAFHHQRFSARAGKTARVEVEGYRMFTPPQAALRVVNGSSCLTGGNPYDEVTLATLTVDGLTSSSGKYVFTGDIAADVSEWKGKGTHGYAVCLCNDDTTADGQGSMFVPATYNATANTNDVTLEVHGFASDDNCATKCAAGCIGPDCYCDGYTADGHAEALCLAPRGCRAACAGNAACEAYSMHRTLNRCFLHHNVTNAHTHDNAEYDLWEKLAGGSCNQDADFLATDAAGEVQKNIGTLYVTQKVDVGVDYVVTPHQSTSLEITGTSLDWKRDRLMVIDCYGTCGVSKPSKDVHTPTGSFHDFVAVNAFIDRPALHEDGVPTPYDYGAGVSFVTREKEYCPGANMEIREDSLADHHSCYQKCFVHGPCTDESCFCTGYFPGHDEANTGALCLEQSQCEDLCAQTPGCTSIDMHRDGVPRCFLNMQEDCAAKPSADYNLLIVQSDLNSRRLKEREIGRQLTPARVRHLLAAEDPGISWDALLRFRDLEFSSGGEYKLCFCDSALLGEGEICNDETDYAVEVGKVHVSGLQCLLSNDKMTRGTCKKQEYDGLRCYDEDETVPTVQVPIDYLGVPGSAPTAHVNMIVSFCQYASHEYTSEFDFCEQYRGAMSPAAVAGTTHAAP